MVKTKNTEKKLDILDGRIIPSFLRFMIPILLTNLLQQLYSTADTMIVGNMGGTDALAAVGATGSIINLLTTIFISVFTGTSILVSRAKGAGDEEGLKRTVTTTAIMSVSFGIILMVLGDLLAYPLLHATKCPESIIDSAARYISIYFIGIPASLFFNFAAAAIRSLGDSRSSYDIGLIQRYSQYYSRFCHR